MKLPLSAHCCFFWDQAEMKGFVGFTFYMFGWLNTLLVHSCYMGYPNFIFKISSAFLISLFKPQGRKLGGVFELFLHHISADHHFKLLLTWHSGNKSNGYKGKWNWRLVWIRSPRCLLWGQKDQKYVRWRTSALWIIFLHHVQSELCIWHSLWW